MTRTHRRPGRPKGSRTKRAVARVVKRRYKRTTLPKLAARIVHDEVWVTQDGRHIQVQDLDLSHARSIIRMMLRAQRINENLASAKDARRQFLAQLNMVEDIQFPDHIHGSPEDQ